MQSLDEYLAENPIREEELTARYIPGTDLRQHLPTKKVVITTESDRFGRVIRYSTVYEYHEAE